MLAYNDAVALLNGKPFVSAAGGTWGKSHAMQHDLAEDFKFTTQTNAEFERFSALDGRAQFILKENPEKKIFHTVQVERNGFIHSMVSGTTNEGKGYEYFGPRAYSKWIQPDLPAKAPNQAPSRNDSITPPMDTSLPASPPGKPSARSSRPNAPGLQPIPSLGSPWSRHTPTYSPSIPPVFPL